MITIYPTPTGKSEHTSSHFVDALSTLIGLKIVPFSSARAALVYGLRTLGIGRMDEILVPPFLAHCVLSALSRTSFPAMTLSQRTKAILVFHQFGYPQQIDYIERIALQNGWYIVNNCAHSLLSTYHGKIVSDWGDFSVKSFPKFYPCNLGGALIGRNNRIQKSIDENYEELAKQHGHLAERAYEILLKARQNLSGSEEQFQIHAVYGYLPEVIAFPMKALPYLPDTAGEIRHDAERRRKLFDIVRTHFPDRIPESADCDVVPFAIPVAGEAGHLERASLRIKECLGVEAPVLHFDFARNMLEPEYKKALIIGCHEGWKEDIVYQILDLIKKEL
jgi:hypothetical protein